MIDRAKKTRRRAKRILSEDTSETFEDLFRNTAPHHELLWSFCAWVRKYPERALSNDNIKAMWPWFRLLTEVTLETMSSQDEQHPRKLKDIDVVRTNEDGSVEDRNGRVWLRTSDLEQRLRRIFVTSDRGPVRFDEDADWVPVLEPRE